MGGPASQVMMRPKIDPKVKKARFEEAQKTARKLNKKLPRPHVYACATEAGRVVVYYEPRGQEKVRLHSKYPSPEFDIELAAAKRGQPIHKKKDQTDRERRRSKGIAAEKIGIESKFKRVQAMGK